MKSTHSTASCRGRRTWLAYSSEPSTVAKAQLCRALGHKRTAASTNSLYKLSLDNTRGLTIIEGEVTAVLSTNSEVTGVELDGPVISCGAVVLATGTFLRGVIHLGSRRMPAGRFGDRPSVSLARSLEIAGFETLRLKTGTPPRLDGRTIDWAALQVQHGDEVPDFFSYLTTSVTATQLPCHITRTTEETHRVVQEHAHLSAVYSGAISGRGPRYCPSIEDKIVRFPDRESHQIFLRARRDRRHRRLSQWNLDIASRRRPADDRYFHPGA